MKTKTTISFEIELEVEANIHDGDLDAVYVNRLGVICTDFKLPGSRKFETKWLEPIPGESAEDFLERILKLKEGDAVDALVTEAAEDHAAQLDEHRERQEEMRKWPD